MTPGFLFQLQLHLLLFIGAGVGLWYLRRRVEELRRHQGDLDLELTRLRRIVDGESVEGAGAAPEVQTEERTVPPTPPAPLEPPLVPPGSLPAPAASEAAPPEPADESEPHQAEPPPPPPSSVPPSPPSPPRRERAEWERWIGVRGAAVLGGVVLALAAILFLKFSIERGLISPPMRVALGMLAGVGAIGWAEGLRKRAYAATANALSGAGVVMLYASVWAAYRLYDLVPFAVAFAMMMLVTAACGFLSWRHRSLVVAMLGLIGGFATPFMLTAEATGPIGLFGYILLLDVGLLVLARERGWPILAGLSLIGTALYQALWIFGQMGPDRFPLTLVILAVFAALFAVAGGLGRPVGEEQRERLFLMIGGVFLPFAFAIHLATRADLGEHVLPIAALLALLSAAACWLGRVHGLQFMAPGAAAASVAVVGAWAARTRFVELMTWEAVGVASGLATLFFLLAGRAETGRRWRGLADFARGAPLVAGLGFLVVLLLSALDSAVAHLWPWAAGWLFLGTLLTLETRGAEAGDPRRAVLPLVALAEVGTVFLWLVLRRVETALAWEVAAVAAALAVFFQVVARQRSGERGGLARAPRSASFVAAAGLFMVLGLAPLAAPASALWPWLAGWATLATLLLVRGRAAGQGYRQIVAAVLFGLSLVVYYLGRNGFEAPPGAALFFGLALAVAMAFQALALARRRSAVALEAETAATIFPILLLLGLLFDFGGDYLAPSLFLSLALFLGVLTALSATRLANGRLYLGSVALVAAVQGFWTSDLLRVSRDPATVGLALAIQGAAVLLFTFWPLLAGRRLAGRRFALYGSALAGALWFLPLKRLFDLRFGDDAIGALPVALAVVALLAALAARRLWSAASPERRRSLVWYLAIAFLFVSVAIPLQLEKEWVTVGWALEGLALLALWRRLDHVGLKYLGLALLGAATVRLILNPAVFGYYPRSGRVIFNWLMYTYLVPAVALLLSARTLAGREVERLLAWEEPFYEVVQRRAAGAVACGLAAILNAFWWINLAVIDYYSVGPSLDLSFHRLPARDLTLSLCWALYALLLLAVGMARKSVGLRWLSLGFLILTIGKVFLYDLGELRDLYRVASLSGLAVSLIAVSLAYQRFVFGRDRRREEGA